MPLSYKTLCLEAQQRLQEEGCVVDIFWLECEGGDEEIRYPPTTHFIATVDDLTDMLDFDSEDIDGMDDDAGEEHVTPTMRLYLPRVEARLRGITA